MPHQHCRDLCRNGLIFPYRRARTHATPIAAPTLPQQQQQAKEQVQAKAQVQAQAPIGPEGGAPVDPMEVREPVEPTSPTPHTPPPLPRPQSCQRPRPRPCLTGIQVAADDAPAPMETHEAGFSGAPATRGSYT